MGEVWAALAGAAVGGMLAWAAAEWSFRRTRLLAKADSQRRELDILDGLAAEVALNVAIAEKASATDLRVAYLHEAMPLSRDMNTAQATALREYARAVEPYNGRVHRIVSYGMGERAAGKNPGAQKPTEHATYVLSAAPAALERLSELASRKRTQAS
jgi:hypothetical protein